MNKFIAPFSIAGILIGLLIWLISYSVEENKMFEAQIQTEYENCIMKKESEYTCKSYVQGLRTKRSADEAAVMSSFAVGYAIGNRGGKK